METTHWFIKAVQVHLLCLQQLRLKLNMRFHSCVFQKRINKNTAYNLVPASFPGGDGLGMGHMTYGKTPHIHVFVTVGLQKLLGNIIWHVL